MLKKIVIESLTEFFSSDAGKKIMNTVINQALEYEVKSEKTDESGRVEIVTERRHALAAMLGYISQVEGAIRGCQADSAAARNKATQTRDLVLRMAAKIYNNPKVIEQDEILEIENVDD